MRIAILRRAPQESVSMDVYADALVQGLKTIRPSWTIIQLAPAIEQINRDHPSWLSGIQKYYERYWCYPRRLNLPDIDLFHIIDHSDGYLSRWLKRYQKPNVVTCHDLINLVQPETFKGRASFPLISMTAWQLAIRGMKEADHVITVSTHTKKDTIQYLQIPAKNITVVPNGVDSLYHPVAESTIQAFRQQQGLMNHTFCLLNVGSNNARKNIDTILAVVATLRQSDFPVHFWKAGADFNAAQKAFIQAHHLEACVTYLGKPDPETLVKIYNSADCLIAPSRYEGFGLTVLEAMACGTAVIAANVTALPEVAGDAAILIDPEDVQSMVAAVRLLRDDPTYQQDLVHKGLERVKRFTWQHTAAQVAQVYETVLATSFIQSTIESTAN